MLICILCLLILVPYISSFLNKLENYRKVKISAKKEEKIRVDDYLIQQGLATDKQHAMRLILARNVLVKEGEIVQSPASIVRMNDQIRLRSRSGDKDEYVSRSAKKLAFACEQFQLGDTINNSSCIDIGSSTGGFTQVLLMNNARKVYAIDVGVSILDYQLRINPRVVVMEKVNARYVNGTIIEDAGDIGIVVCDVSFISLKLVLPPSMALCKKGAVVVALIKPQFECEKHLLGEGGIVRDEQVRVDVVESILVWFKNTFSDTWSVNGTIDSPITGTFGNQEYLLIATKVI